MNTQLAALAASLPTISRQGRAGVVAAVPVGAATPRPLPPTRQRSASQPGKLETGKLAWLSEHIETSRRSARPGVCPRCRAPILTGPDHDTVAATARVDATPVDKLHEVVALLAGRHSYQIVRGSIQYREPEQTHAADNPHPIHLSHQCAPLSAAK